MSANNVIEMEKYQNKYRVLSNRLPVWDYSSNGAYFITLCVNNQNCIFGHIEQNKMVLNDFGEIASCEWEKSAKIRKKIQLGEYIIMPNHLHGIIIINHLSIEEVRKNDQLYRKSKSISSFIAGYKSSVTNKINNFINECLQRYGHGYFVQSQHIREFNQQNKL